MASQIKILLLLMMEQQTQLLSPSTRGQRGQEDTRPCLYRIRQHNSVTKLHGHNALRQCKTKYFKTTVWEEARERKYLQSRSRLRSETVSGHSICHHGQVTGSERAGSASSAGPRETACSGTGLRL